MFFLRLSPKKVGLPRRSRRGTHVAGANLRWSQRNHLPTAPPPRPVQGTELAGPIPAPVSAYLTVLPPARWRTGSLAPQFLPEQGKPSLPGAVAGEDLGHPGVPKAAGQGPDLLVRGGVRWKPPTMAWMGRPGKAAWTSRMMVSAPAWQQLLRRTSPRGVSSTKVCSWEKSSGTHCPARRQNIPAAAPAGPGQGLCGGADAPQAGERRPR